MKRLTVKNGSGKKLIYSWDRPLDLQKKSEEGPGRASSRADAHLDVLVRMDNGQGFPIREKVVVIGRDYDCDLRIEKPCVSRVHAVICRENGSLVLEDLGGRNGTRVNRIAVGRKILADGDRILIGRTELVYKSRD